MLRGFRHTLFLLLQVGVLASGAIAVAIEPAAWRAIAICVAGGVLASLICERVARRYLRVTLGRLRRLAEDIGRGRPVETIEVRPDDDFYKLVSAINAVSARLHAANRAERRLEEELRQRERMAFLGELAASVAHEVNNPLDGVQNCARILRRSLNEPQRSAQMLDLIDSGLARIEIIVRRLLTLARHNVVRPVECRVREIVESATAAVDAKLAPAHVTVVVRRETEDDRALVDPQLLEQVFVNLLLNAADAMPRGGGVTILVRRSAERLCIDFADTGTGISADALPHIFEPFFTTKSDGKGTGLGLPIAARIVDAHHGELVVAANPDGGSVFTVALPVLADLPRTSATAQVPRSARATRELSRAAAPNLNA